MGIEMAVKKAMGIVVEMNLQITLEMAVELSVHITVVMTIEIRVEMAVDVIVFGIAVVGNERSPGC